MQELLQQINCGFKIEKDTSLDSIKERTLVLDEYGKALDKVITKAHEAHKTHSSEVQSVIENRIIEEKKRDLAISVHSNAVRKHEEWVLSTNEQKEKLLKEYNDLCEKKEKVDKIVTGLMTEYRSVEEQISQARANSLAGERRVKELKDEESKLISSIESKKNEYSDLINKIEEGRKQFSLLSNNIASLKL